MSQRLGRGGSWADRLFLLLLTALLYPGDKIIFQKDQVRPIRQPGGYYSDLRTFSPNLALLRFQGTSQPADKKPAKLSISPPPLPFAASPSLQGLECHVLLVSVSYPSMSNPGGHHRLASPRCHPGICLHSLLDPLPYNCPPDHLLYDLWKRLKRGTSQRSGGCPFTDYGLGVRGPAEDSGGGPFSALPSLGSGGLAAPQEEKSTLHWCSLPTLRSTQVSLRKHPPLVGGDSRAGYDQQQ